MYKVIKTLKQSTSYSKNQQPKLANCKPLLFQAMASVRLFTHQQIHFDLPNGNFPTLFPFLIQPFTQHVLHPNLILDPIYFPLDHLSDIVNPNFMPTITSDFPLLTQEANSYLSRRGTLYNRLSRYPFSQDKFILYLELPPTFFITLVTRENFRLWF